MLAPPEGLRAPGVPGVNPGVDPGSQGVIPRRFKRKKIFVTNVVVGVVVAGWTHRREGGNSGLDVNNKIFAIHLNHYFNRHVCLSICPSVRLSVCPSVRHKIFFSLKSPWNHPLTPGVDPWG